MFGRDPALINSMRRWGTAQSTKGSRLVNIAYSTSPKLERNAQKSSKLPTKYRGYGVAANQWNAGLGIDRASAVILRS